MGGLPRCSIPFTQGSCSPHSAKTRLTSTEPMRPGRTVRRAVTLATSFASPHVEPSVQHRAATSATLAGSVRHRWRTADQARGAATFTPTQLA
jgi:hypothetical protein